MSGTRRSTTAANARAACDILLLCIADEATKDGRKDPVAPRARCAARGADVKRAVQLAECQCLGVNDLDDDSLARDVARAAGLIARRGERVLRRRERAPHRRLACKRRADEHGAVARRRCVP